jgi:ferredoxin
MDGEGPTAGQPKKIGYLLASSNAFSLDSAAMDLIHMDKQISYIHKNAESRGFETDYEFVGEDPVKSNIYDFKLPKTVNSVKSSNSKILDYILGSTKSKPFFIYDKCIGCGDCVRNCPAKIISMQNGKPYADEKNCISCYCCAELCRMSAIEIKKPFIIKFLTLRRRIFTKK